MKFKVSDKEDMILIIEPEVENLIGVECLSEKARQVLGDIIEFLNFKYIDKEINDEWGKVNVEARIIEHLKQIDALMNIKNPLWNEHGNGVETSQLGTLSKEELINNVEWLQKTQQKQLWELFELRKKIKNNIE